MSNQAVIQESSYFSQETLTLVSEEKRELIIDKIQKIAEEYFKREKELEYNK